jgi:uncharacterized delta-60 repeat protein
MKYLLVVILSVILITVALAQVDTSWTRRWTSATVNGGDYIYGLAVDNDGNVIVTGGSDYLGTSPELLTIKYNASGDTVWTRVPARAGSQRASAVAVGATGNVYITGYTMENGSGDYITIKYRPNGAEAWVRIYNHVTGYDFARKLVLDAQENVYITGYAQTTGSKNVDVTVKYDSSGTQLWARQDSFGGVTSIGYPTDLGIDNSGNPYIVARSRNSSGNYDYVVAKYNPASGDTFWSRTYNGVGNYNDEARAIAFDASNNVYITGMSASTNTGNYDYNIATIKYNSLGDTQWVRTYNNPDTVATDAGYWIKVDNVGNVYVYGSSVGTRASGHYQDLVLIKYNASGNEQWVSRYNGPAGDHYDTPIDKDGQNGMAVDLSGNIYLTGYTRQLEGPGTQSTENDFITIKFNPAGDTQWTARYNYADSFETAYAMDIDNTGNVYVTGRSAAPVSYYDVATIKYHQAQGIEQSNENRKLRIENLSVSPNPFRTNPTIHYSLSTYSHISLSVYDISGKLVKTLINESKPKGSYNAIWDRRNRESQRVSQGIYFFVLKTNSNTQQKKVLLLD